MTRRRFLKRFAGMFSVAVAAIALSAYYLGADEAHQVLSAIIAMIAANGLLNCWIIYNRKQS